MWLINRGLAMSYVCASQARERETERECDKQGSSSGAAKYAINSSSSREGGRGAVEARGVCRRGKRGLGAWLNDVCLTAFELMMNLVA